MRPIRSLCLAMVMASDRVMTSSMCSSSRTRSPVRSTFAGTGMATNGLPSVGSWAAGLVSGRRTSKHRTPITTLVAMPPVPYGPSRGTPRKMSRGYSRTSDSSSDSTSTTCCRPSRHTASHSGRSRLSGSPARHIQLLSDSRWNLARTACPSACHASTDRRDPSGASAASTTRPLAVMMVVPSGSLADAPNLSSFFCFMNVSCLKDDEGPRADARGPWVVSSPQEVPGGRLKRNAR